MHWADSAVLYISEILTDSVLPLYDVLREIPHAPAPIRRSLSRRLQNLEQLENFFQRQSNHFIVENGKVVSYEPELEMGREKAVVYFEKKLCLYEEQPHYLKVRRHVGQAERNVIYFFKTFYPNKEEFKDFLLAHSDVFFVFNNETVCPISYINVESIIYFKECLAKRKGGLYFMNLHGHLGQAPDHVTEFINTRYPGECFLDFLIRNADVFFVSEDGTVSLIENECVDYFEDCLIRKEKLYFMNLHGHLGQAPDHVIEFINSYYPGKKFANFLRKNAGVFFLQDDGTVSLVENECIDYFKECLINRPSLHFMSLRRHLRQAPDHVIDFVNAQYPEKSFLDFLVKNPNVFFVLHDGTVSLIENECVDYFKKYLVSRRGLYFMNLHGHLGQAPDHVIEFINTHYSRDNFLDFLKKNTDVFYVHGNGTVSLK